VKSEEVVAIKLRRMGRGLRARNYVVVQTKYKMEKLAGWLSRRGGERERTNSFLSFGIVLNGCSTDPGGSLTDEIGRGGEEGDERWPETDGLEVVGVVDLFDEL